MSHSTESVLGRLARKWRDWSRRRRTMMALDCCGPSETTRMALDIGVSETDFRALAGRWPGSSDLLSQRMHQTAWREYCPNSPTFAALMPEHFKRARQGNDGPISRRSSPDPISGTRKAN